MVGLSDVSCTPDRWPFVAGPSDPSGRHPPCDAATTAKELRSALTRSTMCNERDRRLNFLLIEALIVARLLTMGHFIYSTSSVTRTGDTVLRASVTLLRKLQRHEMPHAIFPIPSAVRFDTERYTNHA